MSYTGFDRAHVDGLRARGVRPGSKEEEEEPASPGSAMMEDDTGAASASASAARGAVRRGGGERPGFLDCSMLLAEPPADVDLDAPAPSAAAIGAASAASASAPASASASVSASSSSASVAPPTESRSLRSCWVELRPELQEGVDFTLLNWDAYMRLCEFYGGGPSIIRKVVLVGLSQMELVDLHPLLLLITPIEAPAPGRVALHQRRVKSAPKSALLSDLVEELKPQAMIDAARAHADAMPAARDPATGLEVVRAPLTDAEARSRVEGRVWKKKAVAEGAQAPAASASIQGAAAATPSEFVRAWEICSKAEMASKLEFLEIPNGTDLVVEWRLAGQAWSRRGSGKAEWTDFAVGDIIDVLDPEGKWFEASVLERAVDPVKGPTLRVHFTGWSVKYDETSVQHIRHVT